MKSTAFCWLLFVVSFGVAQDLKYIEYETDLLPPAWHQARRDTLMAQLGDSAIAVFFSSPERTRNNDVEYQYRQDDNFYYLSGFTEPNSILLLAPRGISVPAIDDASKSITTREVLFVQPRNLQMEQWTGRRYGPEGATKLRGIGYAALNTKFAEIFSSALSQNIKYLYVPRFRDDFSGLIAKLAGVVKDSLEGLKKSYEVKDPSALIRRMRVVKTAEEIQLLTKATEISAAAHRQAMMSCEPGMGEYELQAVYEYVFKKMGAESNGYPCIVGAAENSVILHYESDRRKINAGDVLLADCAAEYHGYSSDVTRTYPVNGKFSKAQKEIYQIVLDAQTAAIKMMKPGVAWRDVSWKSDSILKEGMYRIGLISDTSGAEYRKFYMHGLGHPVGLDVHDAGAPVLQEGMLYTVEPGIYVMDNIEGVPPQYKNIGVRIEDVVLVTKDGSKNLSAGAPREIAEIEKLMAKKGIGNQPLK
jgi:Xaa-Pro aminopeptidase